MIIRYPIGFALMRSKRMNGEADGRKLQRSRIDSAVLACRFAGKPLMTSRAARGEAPTFGLAARVCRRPRTSGDARGELVGAVAVLEQALMNS